MLTKIISLVLKLITVAPALVADLESDYSKIKADTKLAAKIHDVLDAAASVFDDVYKALGL